MFISGTNHNAEEGKGIAAQNKRRPQKTQMPNQTYLIPPTEQEQIQELKDALAKHGKHSIYCCWVRDGGYYDRSLGCTCGLKERIG